MSMLNLKCKYVTISGLPVKIIRICPVGVATVLVNGVLTEYDIYGSNPNDPNLNLIADLSSTSAFNEDDKVLFSTVSSPTGDSREWCKGYYKEWDSKKKRHRIYRSGTTSFTSNRMVLSDGRDYVEATHCKKSEES